MRDGSHTLLPPYTHEKDLETPVYNAVHHIMSHDEALQRKVLSFLRRSKHIPDTCESMKKVLGACPGDTAIVSMLRRHYPFDDSSNSIFINVLKNTFEDVNQNTNLMVLQMVSTRVQSKFRFINFWPLGIPFRLNRR